MDWSPDVLISLNTEAEYNLYHRERREHREDQCLWFAVWNVVSLRSLWFKPLISSFRQRKSQRAQHRLRLGFSLLEFPRRVRVGHDPRARLNHDAVLEHARRADRDGRVEARRAPPHVAHGPRVRAAALGLQLVDDLHGAHL